MRGTGARCRPAVSGPDIRGDNPRGENAHIKDEHPNPKEPGASGHCQPIIGVYLSDSDPGPGFRVPLHNSPFSIMKTYFFMIQ